ncbi:hypothetical protein EGR_07453 [Echinococcus granulosus]|uniref:Uncharacterized protein n=1 Tax=Echinococcus granulosus TaxID=6210 RepID=W6UHZ6_ECHGR|nr:hypothetical protein EGR_07453 [Echinococcus granulosus]EUB57712.1 hypothetical protein EGR_07453 [Echinococcus granulosus]
MRSLAINRYALPSTACVYLAAGDAEGENESDLFVCVGITAMLPCPIDMAHKKPIELCSFRSLHNSESLINLIPTFLPPFITSFIQMFLPFFLSPHSDIQVNNVARLFFTSLRACASMNVDVQVYMLMLSPMSST